MVNATATDQAAANRVKAMGHPLRRAILLCLTQRSWTPSELSRELDEDLSRVSQQTRRLVDLGCAELVDERPAPGTGAISHVFRATVRHEVVAEEWEQLSETLGSDLLAEIMRAMLGDFTASTEAKLIGADGNFILARTLHVLDAEGLRDVVAIQEEARERILRAQAAAAHRLAEQGGVGMRVTTWQAAFDLPAR